MARKFLSGIDTAGVATLGFRSENLSAAPTPFGAGHKYFDTTLNVERTYNGTAWKASILRSDQLGTQLSATISDLQPTVLGFTLDTFSPPAAPVNFNAKRLTNVSDPVAAQDAATQNFVIAQVQSAAAGISSKAPVRAVSIANIVTMSGLVTVDSVALAAGDRVLLTAQTTASQNGPWIVSATAWTRPATEGATFELERGALWLIMEGGVYSGTQFRINTTGTIAPGTTAISIVQFAAATAIAQGNGILYSSGSVSIKLSPAPGLVVDTTGLYIDTTVVTRKFALTIGDGTATSYTVTHNLNTRDVQVQVYQTGTPFGTVEVDVNRTDANNVAVLFAVAPALNAYRVSVVG